MDGVVDLSGVGSKAKIGVGGGNVFFFVENSMLFFSCLSCPHALYITVFYPDSLASGNEAIIAITRR